MTSIDEMPELIRVPEPAGRRVIIRDLIAPRTFERMLRHRHQLDVRVTHFQDVGQQRVSKFEITQRAFAFLEPCAARIRDALRKC